MHPKVTVDIDVVRNPCESASNTVEINLKRERDECDDAPPFPITHLILTNVVSFDPHKTPSLLYSTFQDDLLCSRLSGEMAIAAQRVPPPFNMYLHVTQRLMGPSSPISTQDNETCAICLEDMSEAVPNYQQMPNCPHEFHYHCIYMWLSKSNFCPLCRTVLLLEDDDEDDHPYYSETES
ncbi:Zinc finger RING-type [Arabidopsis thaliana x Arabidopsis arenosa]|uniref:RING-type E3 ubiquitin transferase n=1 Tax=Arabidopsis thaliana x Arabidopsis arenosa TaxID=1240361 RepID=A0A8T2BFQ0_9BRAS|nr:Zinc finger RING-type [Arabidopsis thaliana x Arabidopsis arenosa]